MLQAAARGSFPPADGTVAVTAAPAGPADAIVAFTWHAVVASPLDRSAVTALGASDPAAALRRDVVSALASRLATAPGSLDAVLASADPGEDALGLVPAPASASHPRAVRAARYRTDVRVLSDPRHRVVVVLGRGLTGRWEVSLEVAEADRGGGLGAAAIRAARAQVPAHEPLFAQVAPGNAASLRAFLAAGFRPIGAELLLLRRR